MKKKTIKIIEIFKNNWYFLLLLIPFSFLMGFMKEVDNDFWFIINTGRNIVNNGINHTDVFTIHQGLKIIVQQWGTSVIFWKAFSLFGKYGMLSLMLLISVLITSLYYKLCYNVSKNKFISVVLTGTFIVLFFPFIKSRPQIFTYLFIIIELILLEKYVDKQQIKYLFPLPIISLIMINLHASMWIMQFAIMLTFLLNKVNLFKTRINNYRIKPLIIVSIIMFLVGFINPYTYKSVFYFLYSTSSLINKNINEMSKFYLKYNICRNEMIIVLALFFIQTFCKNFKIDIRHFLLICGTGLMMCLHLKCVPYFTIMTLYSIAYGIKNMEFKKSLSNLKSLINSKKILLIVYRVSYISLTIISIFIFVNSSVIYFQNGSYENEYKEMIDKLLENYDRKDIILYSTYNNGGYTEYRGIKSYIDPRAELFIKKHNEKDDILKEYLKVDKSKLTDKEYEQFINKYGFTHFMTSKDSNFYDYLSKNYKLLYEDKDLEEVIFIKEKVVK